MLAATRSLNNWLYHNTFIVDFAVEILRFSFVRFASAAAAVVVDAVATATDSTTAVSVVVTTATCKLSLAQRNIFPYQLLSCVRMKCIWKKKPSINLSIQHPHKSHSFDIKSAETFFYIPLRQFAVGLLSWFFVQLKIFARLLLYRFVDFLFSFCICAFSFRF